MTRRCFQTCFGISPRNPKPKMIQFDLQHISSNGLKLNHQLVYLGVFKKIEVPTKWMVIMENPIKMDDLGYHYFWKHPFTTVTIKINHPWIGVFTVRPHGNPPSFLVRILQKNPFPKRSVQRKPPVSPAPLGELKWSPSAAITFCSKGIGCIRDKLINTNSRGLYYAHYKEISINRWWLSKLHFF